MSKSPLSGAFADSSATTKKKNKKNGAILLISGIALATSIGGVFAANSITINGGTALEFGQGVAATSSCDDGVTTSLSQTFVSTATGFRAGTLTIGGLKTTECADVDLKVSLINASNSAITTTTIRIGTSATATVDYSGSSIDAGTVKAITVTTEK
jgi:hypothetical protein